MTVIGSKHDGSRALARWHLVADANHGPQVLCLAAIILAKKLARSGVAAVGAHACMGFLTLPEFEPEFARWGMRTKVEEAVA